jgi:hypothetical protein
VITTNAKTTAMRNEQTHSACARVDKKLATLRSAKNALCVAISVSGTAMVYSVGGACANVCALMASAATSRSEARATNRREHATAVGERQYPKSRRYSPNRMHTPHSARGTSSWSPRNTRYVSSPYPTTAEKARTYPPLSATQSANTEKVSAHVSGGRSASRTEREGDSPRGGAVPAAAASRGDDAIARERRAATTGPLFRARASGNGPRRDVRHESPTSGRRRNARSGATMHPTTKRREAGGTRLRVPAGRDRNDPGSSSRESLSTATFLIGSWGRFPGRPSFQLPRNNAGARGVVPSRSRFWVRGLAPGVRSFLDDDVHGCYFFASSR